MNWDALRRLRARFLKFGEAPGGGDYWHSASELASYDFTFAERIGWKWDTVLAELRARGWRPPEGTVLDWGCGTGVAGRRVVAQWPQECRRLMVWDRSKPAQHFAVVRGRAEFPNLPVQAASAEVMDAAPELLVVSHVLNELTPEPLERLLALAEKAQAVLWVEPGTAAVSRQLIAVRERLLARFRPVAPCAHALQCGMLMPGNERHWCHHFAKVPGEAFQDGGWGRFSKTLEIDLRSVPFSYLVLDRRIAAVSTASRVIGEPRHYKGFDKVLSCQADGVRELTLQKRDAPGLLKELKKDPGSLYEWEREGEKIRGGVRIF